MELILGDCLEELKKIEDGSIDCVITSPPYDNLRTYRDTLEWGEHIWKPVIKELFRVVKEGGVVVWVVGDATIKGSETGTSFRQALYFKEIGFNLFDTMIYQKTPRGAVGSNKTYWQTFEYMFILSKGQPRVINLIKDRANKESRQGDSGTKRLQNGTLHKLKRGGYGLYGRRTNVWEFLVGKGHSTSDEIAFEHPAIFPEQLARDHIVSWTNKRDTVLDPFMGSGTTGVVCKKLNRDFIGIEIVEEYYELAKERIENTPNSLFI